VNLQALRDTGAGFVRPSLAPGLANLRARFVPEYAALLDAQEGHASPYGRVGGASRHIRLSTGHGAESAPFCGDCHAVRRATGPCAACGSTQPPNLSRMNPRARGMIE
jgi:hypothetical protein